MKNSGISLITVVIMIVIMIILASIAITSGIDSVNEATDTKISVEISEITKAVNNKMIEIERDSTVGMPGMKPSGDIADYAYYIDSMSNSELQDFLTGVNGLTVDYYRIVDSIAAAALGVSSVQDDHYFIVDYYRGKVYGTIDMVAYNEANAITP